MNSVLETKLKTIPPGPGVYLYKDASGQTIYVGKAKSLRNRVRTYFQLSAEFDVRKDQMMDAIEDLEFIMTDTEGKHWRSKTISSNSISLSTTSFCEMIR